MNMKSSKSGLVFDLLNCVFMILFCFTTLYPFMYILTLSVSPMESTIFSQINIVPKQVVWENYGRVFASPFIASGYLNTIIRTVLGTAITLLATMCAAYPLSKKYYPHRSFWTGFIVFTMFFQGGMIPSYLLIRNLGLMNTVWALTLPPLINTFTMLIMRNYFMSLPESLEESARIDGANDILILFKIILPISAPIIAVVVLWTAVWHWNAWFDSMIYTRDAVKQVLQIVLRRVVLEGSQQMMDMENVRLDQAPVNPESVKAATIMVVTVPILLVYPFLQKYFVKGIMVGSLKG